MTTTHPALQYLEHWSKYQAVEPSFWKLVDATRMHLPPDIKARVFTDVSHVNKLLLSRGALRNALAKDIESTLAALDDVDDRERGVLSNLLSVQASMTVLSLAAFRSTKFIIRLDPDMAELLVRTNVPEQLPSSVFHYLPTWSFYLEIPEAIRKSSGVKDLHGAFVTLAASNGKTSLLVAGIGDDGGAAQPVLHIIREFGDTIDMAKFVDPAGDAQHQATEKFKRSDFLLRYITAVAMYMSSKKPDYETLDRPANPIAVRSARGMVFTEKKEPSVFSLGYRIGAAINAASKAPSSSTPGETTGKTMPPHMRIAHWHHFWTGPRTTEGAENKWRKLVLHFLPPIPVNLEHPDQLIATVRPLEVPSI
jgi:hypothetical protein